MAMEAVAAVSRRLRARRIGAQVRATLVFRHAHADKRRAFQFCRTEAAIVVARKDPGQPFGGNPRGVSQGRHGAVSHRDRAIHAAFDLTEHVGARSPRDVGAGLWIRPWTGMEAGSQREPEQLMPRGMEFDFVQPVTMTVQGPKLRCEPVCIVAKLDRLRLAECRAQRSQLAFRPARAFSPNCVAKHGVGRKQIVWLERGWLVLDLEHGSLVIPESANASERTRNPEADPASVSGFPVTPYRSVPGRQSWKQRYLLESYGFGPAHDQVHVL